MEKHALIAKIVAQLDAELDSFAESARAAHAEATDEQNKAESKYDTRGLEASYLARGQSRQATEALEARKRFAALPIRTFGAEEGIDLGASVEIEEDAVRSHYFFGPSAGGTEILFEDRTVLVITPQSPLGSHLLRRHAGEEVRIPLRGNRHRTLRILAVS